MPQLEQVLCRLGESRSEAYRRFNESLLPGFENATMGVPLPVLHSLSKELLSDDWRGFLAQSAQCSIHEVIMLRGLVIARAAIPYEEKLLLTADFVPTIPNWAVCDAFCTALKDARRHPDRTLSFLRPYLTAEEEFPVRFGVVMLLSHCLTPALTDEVLELLCRVSHPGYYAKMAVAWAFSAAYVRDREKTLLRLEKGLPDPWTHNKAIQKCRESRRVSPEERRYLQTLRVQSPPG